MLDGVSFDSPDTLLVSACLATACISTVTALQALYVF